MSGRASHRKQDANEAPSDPWQLTNPGAEQQFTAASVTPPLRCADKQLNSQDLRQEERDLGRLEQLQGPFERLQISPQKDAASEPNTPFNQQDQEMIVQSQNDQIPSIQQKTKRPNAINTAYYKGFRGLHHQHHLVQEQAAQISGNKTKSHLPDDFVHVKNFKNLDSMHTNLREASPDNLPSGRKSERRFFVEALEGSKQREPRGPCAQSRERAEDSRSLTDSEADESEFWPRESQEGDLANRGASQAAKGAQISKNKSRQKSTRQGSVITDLDSILMTDSIDQIVEVTPNNIIYNQC